MGGRSLTDRKIFAFSLSPPDFSPEGGAVDADASVCGEETFACFVSRSKAMVPLQAGHGKVTFFPAGRRSSGMSYTFLQ